MYKSKEIRWFTSGENSALTAWFEKHGIRFDTTEARTDFYLPLDQDNMGIKLREGNIEIKHRVGEPEPGQLTETAEGYFEHWTKWSFQADASDKLSKAICEKREYDWAETWKKRIGVKLSLNGNQELQVHSIKDRLTSGCQLEYTQIKLNGKEFYSFALEWFGEEYIDLPPSVLQEIPGNTTLRKEDSMGYGEFLRRQAGR